MEKRTFNIIMISKGNHNFGKELTRKQAVAHYMSQICGNSIETYTDRVLRSIVWDALMDFMTDCESPSHFLYSLKNARYWGDWSPREDVDDIDAILIAFQTCEVRSPGDHKCVNGFTEEMLSRIDLINKTYDLSE